MKNIKISQIQMPVSPDKAECLACASDAVARAAQEGADIAALPEMFCCPYHVDLFPLYAEKEGGRIWQTCSALAKKYHIYLSAGTLPEEDKEGRIYNTAWVFDREGRQIARHRKMHLFDINVEGGQYFQESATLTAGNSVTTFETEFGTFGLAICFDLRFPELFRLMALRGIKACLVPASFNMTTGPMHWELLARSQALNNQIFLIATAPARVPDSSYVSWAHSIVADPWGRVVSQLGTEPEIRTIQIDLDEIYGIRRQIPVLDRLRTDVYRIGDADSHPSG